VLYVPTEWGKRRQSVSSLSSGYGYVVYGVWSFCGVVGYAQLGAGSLFLLDGVFGAE
jgi:hypothetical protein